MNRLCAFIGSILIIVINNCAYSRADNCNIDNVFQICAPPSFIEGITVSPDIVELKLIGVTEREFNMVVVDSYKGDLRRGDTVTVDFDLFSGTIDQNERITNIRDYYKNRKDLFISKEGITFEHSGIIIVGEVDKRRSKRLKVNYPLIIYNNSAYWMSRPYSCSSGDGRYRKIPFLKSKDDILSIIKKLNEYLAFEPKKTKSLNKEVSFFKEYFEPKTRIDTALHHLNLIDAFMIRVSDKYQNMSRTNKIDFFYRLSSKLNNYLPPNKEHYKLSILGYDISSGHFSNKEVQQNINNLLKMSESTVFFEVLLNSFIRNTERGNNDLHQSKTKKLLDQINNKYYRRKIRALLHP